MGGGCGEAFGVLSAVIVVLRLCSPDGYRASDATLVVFLSYFNGIFILPVLSMLLYAKVDQNMSTREAETMDYA